MMDKAKCRGCGSDILWTKTLAGKKIPLDAKPEKRFIAAATFVELIDTYQSHFVTCPKGAEFRKR